jgi:hypothetical protein
MIVLRRPLESALDTLIVIDGILKLFRSGEKWCREHLEDGTGRYCLLGAIDYIGKLKSIDPNGARTLALRRQGFHLTIEKFNDACSEYEPVRELLLAAQQITEAQARGRRRPRGSTATTRASSICLPRDVGINWLSH